MDKEDLDEEEGSKECEIGEIAFCKLLVMGTKGQAV